MAKKQAFGFRFGTLEQRFVFGSNLLERELPSQLAEAGIHRVAVLTSSSIFAKGKVVERIEAALSPLGDLSVVETWSDIHAHAPIVDTERIALELADSSPDALIAIGGGSVSDTAKAAAIILAEGGSLKDHCSVFTPPDKLVSPSLPATKIPVFVVPTTLAGAEVTPGGGATDENNIKRVFWDPKVVARSIFYDAGVFETVPEAILTTTGMNALAHCAEGLYSRGANPFSTGLALEATELLVAGLAALAAGDRSEHLYLQCAAGAALSGLVITNARVGVHHAICHGLGARGGLSHGVANSIMLPHVLRFNADATEEPQARFRDAIAAGLGRSRQALPEAWKLVQELQELLRVPTSLEEAGLGRDQLPAIANDTMQDRGLYFNPRRIGSESEVLDLLEVAWPKR